MTDIQIFKNEKFGEVRVTMNAQGEPMFCLADVCKALEIKNTSDVKTRLKEDGVGTAEVIDALGRTQTATFVSEANLYKCIFQSRVAKAEQFQDWVCDEVLPTLRKTGSYSIAMPKTLPEALRLYADEIEKRQQTQFLLDAKTEQLDESKEWFSIKRWAKLHRRNWRSYSWRKLKAVSHELGYEVKKIFDGNYDEVNIYHRVVFEAVYGK